MIADTLRMMMWSFKLWDHVVCSSQPSVMKLGEASCRFGMIVVKH